MSITVTYPYTLTNGTTEDATQVMANFNAVTTALGNAAAAGVNTDITSLLGLTTAVPSSAGGVPTGVMMPFAGPVASVPAGWLSCDGSAVSRTTYTALFGVIGTAWGAGDGSTTFNLPDGRGYTVAGFDASNATGRLTGLSGGVSAAAVGNTGGEQSHQLTIAELAKHSHNIFGSNAPSGTGGILQNSTGASQDASHGSETAGTDSGHNNVQPTMICLWIIKT